MKKLTFIFFSLYIIFLTGCATTTQMALSDINRQLSKNKNTYLMTASIRNDYHESFKPEITFVKVNKGDGKEAKDRLQIKMDDLGTVNNDSKNGVSYLMRLELEAGIYKIMGFDSMSNSFPRGYFFTPILADLESSGGGVIYLGRIDARVRERVGNEFKAGPSLPLLDQFIVGASGGTFEVTITDDWQEDEKLFISRFPALKGTQIIKQILPPFDKDKAQKWWEAN